MKKRNINDEFRTLLSKKFNLIMEAAIEQNKVALENIIADSFRFTESQFTITPFSITMDGHTPLSRLAFDGKDEAVKFLISMGGYFLEACIGYAASENLEKCLALFSNYPVPDSELLIFYERSSWLSVNNENQETILQKDDYRLDYADTNIEIMRKLSCVFGIVSALASKGFEQSVIENNANQAFGIPIRDTLKYIIIGQYHAIGCTAMCDDFDLKTFIKNCSGMEHEPIIEGLLCTGNLILINALLKEQNFFNKRTCTDNIINKLTILGYMQHRDLVGYLSHALDSRFFSGHAELFCNKRGAPVELVQQAINPLGNLKHRYKNISLNYFQLKALLEPSTIIWILQGVQMVKLGVISKDILIHIFRFLSELSYEDSVSLFDQIQFKYMQGFLINDIQKYTDGIKNTVTNFAEEMAMFFDSTYKKSKPHFDRAVSFLRACEQTKSLPEVESLLARQYSLFTQKSVSKEISKNLHDEPFSNKEEDDYTRTIVRHFDRMTGV